MNRRVTDAELGTLREPFAAAWCELAPGPAPDFAELVTRYSEPHRAYHTLEHLLDCVQWLAATRDQAERPAEVALALFYHDAVYDPSRRDNEARSADVFQSHADASQLSTACTERIAALIEATAKHAAHDADSALVNDIDLAILGSSPLRFDRYEQQIRREYAHVDARPFALGRKRFLRSLLETTAIYATDYFFTRLEAQARTNLGRALDSLPD